MSREVNLVNMENKVTKDRHEKPLLRIQNLAFSYQEASSAVLENINLDLYSKEMVSVLGSSGVGKTTLFHLIAGIYKPSQGSIELLNYPDCRGQVSYMLQKDMLFEHKTVLDNIILPLIISGQSKAEAREEGLCVLKHFDLHEWATSYPAQLSGGMRQRVALLRTSLFKRPLVLLDEAFSAVDTMTKASLHTWYNKLKEELGLTTLLITHDIEEALTLSDRIYLIKGKPGRIVEEIDLRNIDKNDKWKIFKLREEILQRNGLSCSFM